MILDPDPARILRWARQESGLTQRALADRAGTSQSVVARIELGRTSPTLPTLRRLVEAAGQRMELRLRPSSPALEERAARFFGDRSIPGLVSAYLYGSVARRERHGESDVDLAVLLDPAVHVTRAQRDELRLRLTSRLMAALGMDPVDLVILNDVPPGLARAVVLDGTRLVAEDEERDHAFRRDVQLRCADLEPFLRRARRLKLEAIRR